MIQITRFPFLFWGMRNEPEAYFDGKYIKKGEHVYEVKKAPILLYIFAKYIIIYIGLIIIFTKHDFAPSLDKFLQYAVALLISFLVLVLPRKYITGLIIFLAILAIITIFTDKLFFISFVLKYFITFFVILSTLLDYKKDHYYMLKNNKIVANAIVGGE